MKQGTSAILIAGLFVLAVILLLASCSRSKSEDPAVSSGKTVSAGLVQARDEQALEARIRNELIKRYEIQATRTQATDGTAAGGTDVPGSFTTGSETSEGYSRTNVQEQGVDEGDIVKTDGTFLYLGRGSRFLVIRAAPVEDAGIASNLDLQEPIRELILSGSTLAVISSSLTEYPAAMTDAVTSVLPSRSFTSVSVYDVSSPAAPRLTARFTFPGALQGSRLLDGRMLLVTNHTIDLPARAVFSDYLPMTGTEPSAYDSAVTQALTENIRMINSMTLSDMLPFYTITEYVSSKTGTGATKPLLAAEDVYFPESGNGTDLSLVISLDLSAQVPPVAASGVLSSWCRIYLSTENLYLASGNDWLWIEPMTDGVQEISEPFTALHKFNVSGALGKPVYRASGIVSGWLNDRFSMGEFEGYLRIGTTRGGWWGEAISNGVTILAEDNGYLKETGKIAGLAPGERIYSMRFDRDRAYMVTFRQTDPLFTLDLKDPTHPRVAGEIKVNGFATYIHLLGPDSGRLLTIGRSADATGRVTGNKLQLFDVSNPEEPRLLGNYELGAGWSDALHDPHAFLSYEPLGLLAIPYFNWSMFGNYQSGLQVFTVGASNLSLRGIVSAPSLTTGYGSYQDTIDRSVIIGSRIYSIAHRSVTVADASQLEVQARIDLPECYAYPYSGGGGVVISGGAGAGTGTVSGGSNTGSSISE